MNAGARYTIIVVVSLVWAANYTAPVFIKDYVPNEQLNIAFMTIIGLMFNLKKKNPDAETAETREDGNDATESKGK